MAIVVNMFDYKIKDNISNLIETMSKDIYNICISKIKSFDVYTYIDIDTIDLLYSSLLKLNITEELESYIISHIDKIGGVYSYLYSIGSLNEEDINCVDILITMVEDKITEMLIEDGFKICYKLDEEDISIFDGDALMDLDRSNVFDRIIIKVLESIPYEIVYIR